MTACPQPSALLSSTGPRTAPAVTLDAGSVEAAIDSGRSNMATAITTPLPMSAIAASTQGPLESVSRNDPYIGTVFGGKYVIERVLGVGGMGIVYAARHQAIGKRFAVKLLHGEQMKDPEVVERFKVEAQSASGIGNEHIIDITDFAELPNGSTYFVMEMLDGKPLSQLFEELHAVPVTRLTKIAKQIAQGLGAAHAVGIVHRDLKPDNIYLCKRSGGETDFVKILDFGIAKVGQSANKLTKAGAIFGTPHYMSPEQASGLQVDLRTDIYALGVILYEGAVGRVPFDADNFMGILTQHMYKAPIPPRALAECPPDMPAGLEVIIMRCLRKKADERYQTMQELEDDLDRLARGEVPKAAHDMMALSAGYQSIAQSALAASMPTPIPGMPPGGASGRSKVPVIAGVAGVLAVVAIAAFALIGPPGKTHADASSNTAAGDVAGKPTAAPPVATPVAAASVAVAPTPAKTPREILIATPGAMGAKVYEGDKLLSDLPCNVDLEAGKPRSLTIKAAGYIDKTVTLDDATPSRFEPPLDRLPMAKGPMGPPAAPVVKKKGDVDVDDPWAKKP